MNTYTPSNSHTSSVKTFTWLVRRELWEHRAFWIVPAVVMGIIILAHIAGLIQGLSHLSISGDLLPHIVNFGKEIQYKDVVDVISAALVFVIGLASGIVSVFYLLDTLYSERRDRSVLFWKSLPITDQATVSSKLFTGVVVLPIIALAAALVTYVCIVLLLTLAFGFREGFSLAGLWNPVLILGSFMKWTVFTLTQQVWFLPVYTWLLFCSAFSRKAPFLVAVLVPLGIGLAEQLAYRHSYLGEVIGKYFAAFFITMEENSPIVGGHIDFSNGAKNSSFETISLSDILYIFTQPQLYAGLVVAAIFIFATIWWRRHHVEMG